MNHPSQRVQTAPRATWLWVLAGLLVLAVAAMAVYRAWPVLHPQIIEQAPLAEDCDLRASACRVGFASGGGATLDIQPRGIPLVHPLQIAVTLDGLAPPRRVELDLTGVDMDMGLNRVALHPGDRPGSYVGEAMLPVCVRDSMRWQARVLLHTADGIRAASFRFDTHR